METAVAEQGRGSMVYTISIGSNEQPASHLTLARTRLEQSFPGIRFSPVERTEPLLLHHRTNLFANQVARFSSDLPADAVRTRLKAIEREAGRRPEDNLQEIVRLDLDLLTCDATVFKPDDLRRDFIARAISRLST